MFEFVVFLTDRFFDEFSSEPFVISPNKILERKIRVVEVPELKLENAIDIYETLDFKSKLEPILLLMDLN